MVDLSDWKPYCSSEIRLFSLKYSTNLLCIHFSSIFPGKGSMVIGLQFDMCNKFPCFGMAIFHFSGNLSVCRDLLNNSIKSSFLCAKNCFKMRVGIFEISDAI